MCVLLGIYSVSELILLMLYMLNKRPKSLSFYINSGGDDDDNSIGASNKRKEKCYWYVLFTRKMFLELNNHRLIVMFSKRIEPKMHLRFCPSFIIKTLQKKKQTNRKKKT